MFSEEFSEGWDGNIEFIAAVKVMEFRELFRCETLGRQEGAEWWFAG